MIQHTKAKRGVKHIALCPVGAVQPDGGQSQYRQIRHHTGGDAVGVMSAQLHHVAGTQDIKQAADSLDGIQTVPAGSGDGKEQILIRDVVVADVRLHCLRKTQRPHIFHPLFQKFGVIGRGIMEQADPHKDECSGAQRGDSKRNGVQLSVGDQGKHGGSAQQSGTHRSLPGALQQQ